MKMFAKLALASVSLTALATPAVAQDSAEGAYAEDDIIIVQARRRDESIQDVPVVVQAVTSEDLQKLNIRDFQDVQTLVPGLQMDISDNGIGTQTTLRGIAFDVNASGNNGTVEFYYNDSPIASQVLFQSLFDVGQIEVLRGPQGTLRGRASPSGSITVTSRKPNLSEAGGYMEGTINDIGGWNLNGAINVPVVADIFALRLAGIVNESDGNEVVSLNHPAKPFVKNQGIRVSAQAEPFDALSLFFTYGRTSRDAVQFDQVESLNIADPGAPASAITIAAADRLAVMGEPRTIRQDYETFNWQAELRLFGQKLNYVGSQIELKLYSNSPYDNGGVFAPDFPQSVQALAQTTNTKGVTKTHEIRLSNDDRIAGMFDYVFGYLNSKSDTQTDLASRFPLFGGILSPNTFITNISTPVLRPSGSREESFFGNLTAHITDQTEISVGARHINYANEAALLVNGSEVPAGTVTFDTSRNKTWIYSASLKHRFNQSLMAYASFGTSWRPGGDTNAIILRDVVAPSPTLAGLYFPDDEKSKSYEIGVKTDLMDGRLRFNLTGYYQDFKNFAYFANNVYYGGQNSSGTDAVFLATGIAVGVPADVKGVEAELEFEATPNWNIGAVLSYSKSKFSASVPCNDFNPNDGVPDSTSTVPTPAELLAATNGAGVAFCDVSQRAGLSAPFSATATTEYNMPIAVNTDGYIRGLLTYNGNSQNDPTNPFDDIDGYALLNLYAGVRAADGSWDIGVFAKNVFDSQRVLSRDSAAYSAGYRTAPTFAAANAVSTYRGIRTTAPQEFGITARIALGSR